MLDTLYIENRLKEEIEIKQIALELNINHETFYRMLMNYDIEITYQKYVLRNELSEFLRRNNLQKLSQASGMNEKTINKMMKREEITFKALVRILNFFSIPYNLKLVKFEPSEKNKTRRGYVVDFPNRAEWERRGKEVTELKDKRGEELYSHLITSHAKKLRMILSNKNIGSMTEGRIIETVTDIIRESINLGKIIERNQDDGVIAKTFKAINERKVIDVDKDVL